MTEESNVARSWPTFVVVARASAAIRFGINDPLELHVPNFPSPLGPLDVTLRVRTPYADEGLGVPVPQAIEIAVRGKAPTLDDAMRVLGQIGTGIVPSIALSANAEVRDAVLVLAYDASPGVKRRPFYQYYSHPQSRLPAKKRRVDVPGVLEVFRAAINHPDDALLGTAMAQYHVALTYLGPGQEILALAHLYMATDALTNVALRHLYAEQDIPHGDKTRLARALGVDKDMLRDAARETVVFQGDTECYKTVKAASDGFEHGYMPIGDVRTHALATRDRTMGYVRSALLTLAAIDDAVRDQLLKPPFDVPYPDIGVVKYLRGAIVGRGDTLAADGCEYPFLEWTVTPRVISRDQSGTSEITLTDSIRPVLNPDLSFEIEGFGTGGLVDHPSEAPSSGEATMGGHADSR